MADQATIDRPGDRPTRIRANLAGLAHDALTLAELQVQLLTVDLRDARRGAGTALSQVLIGAVLALGCVPVLILAAAHLLIEIAEWPASGAYAVGAILAAVAAMILLRLGWRRTSQALATVQRSRTELLETLRWLKESLRPAEQSNGSFSDQTD
jgi:protein-S-isoprenylcysteine O-methyltransferase Ste14